MIDSLLGVYLEWLAPQTGVSQRRKTYWDLLTIMHDKEFVWMVPNDDNRIVDGLDIRREFFGETGLEGDLGPCSVLEVLIGLTKRIEFVAGGDPPGWGWIFLGNLGLQDMWDPVGPRKALKVDEILETFIWRTYSPDGAGGLFPLQRPDEDQTQVEIWYQMAAYVLEIHPEY